MRALTAVAALYALVLQALLGSIAALPVGVAPGLLCARGADGIRVAREDTDAGGTLPPPGPHHAAGCCTAAGHAPAAGLPPSAAGSLAWPEPAAESPGRIGPPPREARPPPFTLAHARAPPAA